MALKASPDDQAALLSLQRLDTKLAQLEHRAKTLPEMTVLADLGKQTETLRIRLGEQQGVLENTRLELGRVEADVRTVEARIERDTQRLQGSSSVKDVAALEQELGALRKRLNDLEEIELTVMERAEQQEADVAGTQHELAAIGDRRLEAESTRDLALAAIEADRATAAAGRREIASRLPDDLLALYERQRSRYGTGASLLRGGVSEASGVALNADDLATVRSAAPDDVLLCPSSDAILVRTDESGL